LQQQQMEKDKKKTKTKVVATFIPFLPFVSRGKR
jgi:hypothetical protein